MYSISVSVVDKREHSQVQVDILEQLNLEAAIN